MPRKKQPHKSAPGAKKKAQKKRTTKKTTAAARKPKTRKVVKKVGQVEPVPQPPQGNPEDQVYQILGRVVAGMMQPPPGTPEFGQQAFGRWDRLATLPAGQHPLPQGGTLQPGTGTYRGLPIEQFQSTYPQGPPMAAPPAPFSDRMDMVNERATMEGVFGVKRGTALPSEAKKSNKRKR